MGTASAESNLPTAKTILSAAASVAATVMLARSVTRDFVPHEFQDYIVFNVRKFFSRFSSQLTMVVDEFDGFVSNQIYEAAEIYLASRISPSTHRLRVIKAEKENKITVKMERHEEVEDVFQGVKFKWVLVCTQVESRRRRDPFDYDSPRVSSSENRAFEVTFPRKHKDMVLESYLPYIVKQAKFMMQEKKTLKIFTIEQDHMYGNLADTWRSVNLDHPATFDTLAIESEIKTRILKDLEMFVKRKDYYRKVGKAWKRGYLLYGPPGTGKSSLIAAMANYLNFDIYDLDLTDVRCNAELRRVLVATANQSILVLEDIDCMIEFQDRMAEATAAAAAEDRVYPPQKQVTLSGLLNFIDGLWSSCGDERIIVFTTNHKDKLDPALLRPGRMDVHVHMSYCTPCGFQTLAANYLGIKDHALFGEIEELIRSTEVTPAEVAEQLLRTDDLESVLKELIVFLHAKMKENEEAKARKKEEEDEKAKAKNNEDGSEINENEKTESEE